MPVIGGIFLILGIVFLICYPVYSAQNKRRSEETTGTVTNIHDKIRHEKGSRVHYDHIYTMAYKVNGNDYTFDTKRTAMSYEIGRELTVKYNPAKPEDAHVLELHGASAKPMLIMGLIFSVAGLLMIFAGLIM